VALLMIVTSSLGPVAETCQIWCGPGLSLLIDTSDCAIKKTSHRIDLLAVDTSVGAWDPIKKIQHSSGCCILKNIVSWSSIGSMNICIVLDSRKCEGCCGRECGEGGESGEVHIE
jgi:hypothetical protein